MMFTAPYKAAVVQMNSQTDIDQNLQKAYNYIKEAADHGAKVIGLPENFSFLGGLSMRMEQAEVIAEKVPDFLSHTAKEFDVYILGGSYPVPATESKVFNRSPLYNSKGEEVINYNKIHLFDVELSDEEKYKESDYVEAGVPEPAVYSNTVIGSWGLSVCYDLRFPEYYRLLTDRGAAILSIPSAFTYTTGKHHWLPLLRARAIENTSYVFAPAQTGLHGDDRRTWGHAVIIDPWGEVVSNRGEEPGIAIAEINPSRITEVRKAIPSLNHRRF
ncbi:carbon-nitrogen hydrolase family protein [Aliifodinibius salicampi]|uniref:Carbon-nitrogen hydrolase family protein n=1 Tax=Fodinibius salicampi TaxID=1920655 RepID=A0ABT3PVX3_9BACT|nr:carbon-nitrogen hydrolase family protein [Fodinibius salicampi]MCW9711981.1 carbon-nitrogen hydrolase family protein [Fodinibius salicampi]